MGAVLWSILALIFVLLSLPDASGGDHAGDYLYYGEQLLAARGHERRARSSEDDDTARGTTWSCQNESRYDDLEKEFLARINESVQSVFQQFTGPLLVHAVRLVV
jgi:hypothetical protein